MSLLLGLSAENRDLVGRKLPHPEQALISLSVSELNLLLDAARAEGPVMKPAEFGGQAGGYSGPDPRRHGLGHIGNDLTIVLEVPAIYRGGNQND